MSEFNRASSNNTPDKKPSRRNLLIGATMGVGMLGVGAAGIAIGRGSGEKQPIESQLPTETKQPAETDPAITEPAEQRPEVDPYETQAWGGIEPGLEGEKLIEALSIPENATPEEAADKFVQNLNYLLMGDCTPEKAKEFADLDPYAYLRDEDFMTSLITGLNERKHAFADASYAPSEINDYTYDTPFELTGVDDNQAFNNILAMNEVFYSVSYNDETASEPYRLQLEPIHTTVTEEGNVSVLVNIERNLNKSGDSVNELDTMYLAEDLSYSFPKHAEVHAWIEKDEASGRYKFGQAEMNFVED